LIKLVILAIVILGVVVIMPNTINNIIPKSITETYETETKTVTTTVESSIIIDSICDKIYPDDFSTYSLNYENVLENGQCFPMSNLASSESSNTIHNCRDTENNSRTCDVTYISLDDTGNGVYRQGIITDSNGVAFVNMECIMGNNWAICN
jgi:hypothetical protein